MMLGRFEEMLAIGEEMETASPGVSIEGLLNIRMSTVTALFMLAAPLLMRPFHPVDLNLAVGLSRVLFPIVALLGVSR